MKRVIRIALLIILVMLVCTPLIADELEIRQVHGKVEAETDLYGSWSLTTEIAFEPFKFKLFRVFGLAILGGWEASLDNYENFILMAGGIITYQVIENRNDLLLYVGYQSNWKMYEKHISDRSDTIKFGLEW